MRRTRTALWGITLSAMLAVTGCTGQGSGGDPSRDPDASGPNAAGDDPVAVAAAWSLQPAESCDELLDHFVDNALEQVTAWGLPGMWDGMIVMDGDVAMMEEAAAADDSARAGSDGGGEGDSSFSTTNTQEVGVDEPDVVKNDGQHIVLARDHRIRIVDAAAGEVVGTLALDNDLSDLQLLLQGDDLLVSAVRWAPASGRGGEVGVPSERTELVRVDLSDPTEPEVVGRATIEGNVRSMRMVDGTVRVVLQSLPTGLVFEQPRDGGLSAEQEALEHNRNVVAESDIDDWLPHLQVTTRDGTTGDVTPLHDCGDVAIPGAFQGFATVSVITMDLDDDAMEPTSTAGIAATGETVYASTDRLVVATSPWGQWRIPVDVDESADAEPDDVTTQLHVFDITDPAATAHVASGAVDGTLINQFAIDEQDGILRVATTTGTGWWGGSEQESQSQLLVLQESADGGLDEVGRVDGMGVTERIYSVRYLSADTAAVVTFRETDPLYLVDTSDPANPKVTGELKIPGFSTYLHPIGDDRLIGIGQDATDEGRTTGLQLSLFDVSDTANPRRVDQVRWANGWSPAEHDHHAFLWWDEMDRVVVPMEQWPEEPWNTPAPVEDELRPEPTPFLGIVSVDVDGQAMAKGPRAGQTDKQVNWDRSVTRTLVIGDDLWAVSWNSLARHDLTTLEELDRIRL